MAEGRSMFYVTTRALTTGIEVFSESQCEIQEDGAWLYLKAGVEGCGYGRLVPPSQWFRSEGEAQIAKLEALTGFQVVRA